MQQPKYLIEVAMPIREVSAESVRDKSIRHGHISTLHLWWARRPLPVCRAVVFASLVPDPDDAHCSEPFRQAVIQLLADECYQPYADVPFTTSTDPLADTLRNRLLAFMGKFSDQFVSNERAGRTTAPKEMLAPGSLIKWESRTDEAALILARKLIFVAHNSKTSPAGQDVSQLLADFDRLYATIREAEKTLYQTPDRHLDTPDVAAKETALQTAISAFLNRMPRVFDPFAGGGAIPLEAARLGCRTFGNDINPVAHIIQRGSLEFPQRYGKPALFSKTEFERTYGTDAYEILVTAGQVLDGATVELKNRLSFDVAFYARKLLKQAKADIGHLYPEVNGRRPIAYYWARTGTCTNPACRAEVPLLKGFYLCNKPGKQVYLKPVIEGNQISFELKHGATDTEGFVQNRKNMRCPVCGNTTTNAELKQQFLTKTFTERLLAVIDDGDGGKTYRLPTAEELSVVATLPTPEITLPEKLAIGNTKQFDLCPWGFVTIGSMFSNRQLLALQTLVGKLADLKKEWGGEGFLPELTDYQKAIVSYLAIWIDRVASVETSFGRWHTGRETLEHPFARQAIPMTFDYPEANPFSGVTGSAKNQLDRIIQYIDEESNNPFAVELKNASSGDVYQFPAKYLDAVITDPPYYDAIAYADLSDFFYVWLKRSLSDVFPLVFALPQTPKAEECTALKHHHQNSVGAAKAHFEQKLRQILAAIEAQTNGVVSVMFAHQSTEAWTTLCHSVLGAKMNITGSWAMDTELGNRMVGIGNAALESSVTVACRPSEQTGIGDFRDVRAGIEAAVRAEVRILYALGFRGADLLTACFGQAVSVFGQYRRVEKPNGDAVTVAELLVLARDAAFNAIVSDIRTDDYTRFYLGWLQLHGFLEAAHDDVRRVVQVGLSVNVADIENHHLLLQTGNRQTLATATDRVALSRSLGQSPADPMIDQLHQTMHRWANGADRRSLVQHVATVAPAPEADFWRVLAALFELLPKGSADHRAAEGLLSGKDSLLREARALGQIQAGPRAAMQDVNQLGIEF